MATDWSVPSGVEAWIVSIDLVGFSRLSQDEQTAWRTVLTEAARRGLLSRDDREQFWASFLGDEIRVAFDAGRVGFEDALGWTKSVLERLFDSQQVPKPQARAFVIGPGKVLGERLDEPPCRYLDGPLSRLVDMWGGAKPKLAAWNLAATRDIGPGAKKRRFGSDTGWVIPWPRRPRS